MHLMQHALPSPPCFEGMFRMQFSRTTAPEPIQQPWLNLQTSCAFCCRCPTRAPLYFMRSGSA
eukprot:666368-Prymnesium_polylepis.1